MVAVLDFEAAGRGKFIFDLATAVNALCFESGRYALKRFEALIAGYETLRTLSLAEWDAFPNELRFSAFRFTVTRLRDFFLNPVDERQRINKDFQDFYERLLHPAPRARRRHGSHADGHGDRLRLPQVPEGQGRRSAAAAESAASALLAAAHRASVRICAMNGDSLLEHSSRRSSCELGEDPKREGLVKTPERVARALRFLTKGYDGGSQGGHQRRAVHRRLLGDDRAQGPRLLLAVRAPHPAVLRQGARRLHPEAPHRRHQQAGPAGRGLCATACRCRNA